MTKEDIFNRSIPEPNSGCWIWDGPCNFKGYGMSYHNKKKWYAHRLSYSLHAKTIECRVQGMDNFILHHCDVSSCVNPDHLYMGTLKQNADDVLKRRGRYGTAKLTSDQVFYIRQNPAVSVQEFAFWYGVYPATIRAVRSGRVWKHLLPAASQT